MTWASMNGKSMIHKNWKRKKEHCTKLSNATVRLRTETVQLHQSPWWLLEKQWWTSGTQYFGNLFDPFSAAHTAKVECWGSGPSTWATTKKIQTKYTMYIGSSIIRNALHYTLTPVLDFREAKHSFMKPPVSCLPVVEQFIFFETMCFFPLQWPHSTFIFLRL